MTKDQFIKEAASRGIVPGATVQKYAGCSMLPNGTFVVPPTDKFYQIFNDWAWMTNDGAPDGYCWLYHNKTWATVITPAPAETFKVGDRVDVVSGSFGAGRSGIFKGLHPTSTDQAAIEFGESFVSSGVHAHGCDRMTAPNRGFWVSVSNLRRSTSTTTPMSTIKVGDIVQRTSGKQHGMLTGYSDTVTKVQASTGTVTLKIYGKGHAISKLKVVGTTGVSLDDSEIRVGDTVRRVKGGSNCGMNVGDEAVVTKINSCGDLGLDKGTSQGNCVHSPGNYIKINNGARPVSGKTNTNTDHGKVSGQFEGEGDGCGEGRAVRAQSSTGRIATGEPLACHPGKGGLRGAAVAGSEVPVPTGR